MLANLVYDNVWWDEDGVPGEEDKVQRRVPSGLDVAFCVLGNSQVVPELVVRLTETTAWSSTDHAVRWRDGLRVQHNLAALRNVMDRLESGTWSASINLSWLGALRALSEPTTASEYPEAMRTRAWAMKTLNTQLASWTQLRHDTILYAKPSYTGGGKCWFPAGYVEPRPVFWRSLEQMARRTRDLLSRLELVPGLEEIRRRQTEHLDHFAATTATLRSMAEKELAGLPFDPGEEIFLHNLLEYVGRANEMDCIWRPAFEGWYPQLFYRPRRAMDDPDFHRGSGIARDDFLVADVHTDVPYPEIGDPGSVLHEGVGRVHLLMLTASLGGQPIVFAGPVLSHFEFERVGTPLQRLDDQAWAGWVLREEWRQDDGQRPLGPFPPSPEWTRSYLVGGW